MKNVIKHVAASIAGSLIFLLLLNIEDLLDFLGITERSEFKYPPHVALSDLFMTVGFFAGILILQLALVAPIFHYLKKSNKYTNKNILIVATLLSLTLGAFFGLTLGAQELGTNDVLLTSLMGIGIFSLQYLANFLTYIGIERKLEKRL